MAANETTTFISLFHSPEHAESALSALEAAGFSRAAITSTWNSGSDTEANDYRGELTDIGVPDRDLQRLEKGIADGGVVISLSAPESRSDDIERIFHRYTAEKIDETDLDSRKTAVEPFVAPTAQRVPEVESAVVPIVEESLLVGKREVDRGGVRVFQRVVEEPVSEKLKLHEEHVVFERRPVDRAVTDADLSNAGQTIELTETDEVPVISKGSRVVEEVHVGVVGSDRTETIRDTVRHTEVEIDQADEGTTGSAGNSSRTKQSY